MSADLYAIAPILVVAATVLVVLVADWFAPPRQARIPAAVALLGLGGAAVVAWRVRASLPEDGLMAFTRQEGVAEAAMTVGLVRVDGLGMYAILALIAITALVCLTAAEYVERHAMRAGEFYAVLLGVTAAMMLLTVAADLILAFLAIETLSIGLYILCAFRRGYRRGHEAALKYFILGAFAAGFLLYGIALLYAETGTTSLAGLGALMSAPSPLAWAAMALLLIGLGFKVALVPFHQWTPDVYEGAPAVVTGFMAAATKLSAFVFLIRVLWTAMPALADVWMPLLGFLAVLSMFVGNLSALVQADQKRMLAYSAIAHAGYVLVAVLAGPSAGAAAAIFYLVAYGLTNVGAFAVLVAVGPSADGERDAASLRDLSGLSQRHPWLAALLALFLLSLTGLPPTLGFLGKWYIFHAALDAGLGLLAFFVVLNSVISAFYYVRPVFWMYMQPPAEDAANLEVTTANAVALTATGAIVGLALAVAAPLVHGARDAVRLVPPAASGGELVPGVFLTAPELDRDDR